MTLRVAREAEDELAAAAEWYEERRVGLGVEPLIEVDHTFETITANPFASPLWRTDRPYRKRVLRQFPYAIFFRLEGELVLVDAIAHVRRGPGYWLKRT